MRGPRCPDPGCLRLQSMQEISKARGAGQVRAERSTIRACASCAYGGCYHDFFLPCVAVEQHLEGREEGDGKGHALRGAQPLEVAAETRSPDGRLNALQGPLRQSDHGAGSRSQRCFRSSCISAAGSGTWSPAAMLARTCVVFRIPGIAVATRGLLRMKRNAISGSVMPWGTISLSASMRRKVSGRFS